MSTNLHIDLASVCVIVAMLVRAGSEGGDGADGGRRQRDGSPRLPSPDPQACGWMPGHAAATQMLHMPVNCSIHDCGRGPY